jgi:hypothetical protein
MKEDLLRNESSEPVTATPGWWKNTSLLFFSVLEMFAQFLVHLAVGIINGIFKIKIEASSDDFRGFGGGRSGGGGADAKW